LLSTLDRANLQEQLNAATAAVSSTSGPEASNFDAVRRKVDVRLARAEGTASLLESSSIGGTAAQMAIVEQAVVREQAQARLAAFRSELGVARSLPPPRITEQGD
jgi:phage shock protein A